MTTAKAFFIKNHSSSELVETTLADLAQRPAAPPFPTKPEFAHWCHNADTDHCFYTLGEPVHPGMRLNASNPIRLLHGIVADYDGAAEAIQAALPKLKFGPGKAPAWVTTTFSGKARLIWVFEKPVPTFNQDVFTRFLTSLVKEYKLDSLLPNLDKGALIENPYTPYELGSNWRQPWGDTRIPATVTWNAIQEASVKAKFKTDGPDIPLEVVAREVERKFPGRWVGPFEVGIRGVRFWDPKADNDTGCTIREAGVQAWTGEGRFLPWAEILGAEFVRQFQQDKIGGAIDGTYFDGQAYWRKDNGGLWRSHDKESIKRHLCVTQGLSSESRRGAPPEVSVAITTVDNNNQVDGAFPCLFSQTDVVHDGQLRYLNISRCEVMPPRDGPTAAWGEGFPWLAAYFEGLFDDHQRSVFLSWFAHFYQNARAGKPRRGQALFVAGPKSAGKTLLSQCIVGGVMGGFEEATRYVLGQTSFNESLFHRPVWCVDDAVGSVERKSHEIYSQMVKKIVANPYQEFHAKFKKAVSFRYNGRLIVTLNDDPTSINMLPTVDGTILDKIIVLYAKAPGVSFAGVEGILTQELPAFVSFLSGYVIPEGLKKSPDEVARFGMDAYAHPELLNTARDAAASAGLAEIIDTWRIHHFRAVDKTEWRGSAHDLHLALANDEVLKPVFRQVVLSRNQLSRDLQNIVRQGADWVEYVRTSTKREYIIKRPLVLMKGAA